MFWKPAPKRKLWDLINFRIFFFLPLHVDIEWLLGNQNRSISLIKFWPVFDDFQADEYDFFYPYYVSRSFKSWKTTQNWNRSQTTHAKRNNTYQMH